MEKTKIIAGVGMIGIALSGIGGAMIGDNSETLQIANLDTQIDALKAEALIANSDIEILNDQISMIEAIEPVIEYIDREVEVEVEKIVKVDNGNLESVLNHIYDNNGTVTYLLDDLDDDELDQIANRVIFINDITTLAIEEVKAEFIDLIDKENFENNTKFFDEDDINRVRIKDKEGDIIYFDVDFEDGDADIRVEVYFEQDDIKYKAIVNVEFKDGEVDDIELVSNSIELR